jgi:hypothetical protein
MFRTQFQVLARAANLPVDNYGQDHFTVTPAIVRELRELTYFDQWKTARKNAWFHLELEDHSLILFSETTNSASFSYLQCPLAVPSFKEFLVALEIPNTPRKRREYRDEYEMVLDTADLRPHITPIRFDYDENGYLCGAHPVSHIHIGLDNNIRLGTNRKLTPISFLLFVMRQMYPDCWKKLLEHQESGRLPRAVRNDCPIIDENYWQHEDAMELHLN